MKRKTQLRIMAGIVGAVFLPAIVVLADCYSTTVVWVLHGVAHTCGGNPCSYQDPSEDTYLCGSSQYPTGYICQYGRPHNINVDQYINGTCVGGYCTDASWSTNYTVSYSPPQLVPCGG